MARKAGGSVRIGPVSIFTLVILLCLAVLSVLAMSTAKASYGAAERQAAYTYDVYQDETAAWEFVSDVDAALLPVRRSGGGEAAAIAAVQAMLPENASIDGSTVSAMFTCESGKTLDIELAVKPDGTYKVLSWIASTSHDTKGEPQGLWSGM